MAGINQFAGRCSFARIEFYGPRVGHGVVVRQPECGHRRIGQVLFVEYLQRRSRRRQLSQLGVGTRPRQARVKQLNDYINFLDALTDRFLRQVHVPWKPLDCHCSKSFVTGTDYRLR